MRWGLGPVFVYECLANSRRWQIYAARSVGVAALMVAMTTIAVSQDAMFEARSWREYARLGESYFYAMIGVELALVMLAAPAATAGAICLDRSRGTLAHILATELSDPGIILGKLAARLLPVLGLVACSWPVLALSSLLGGIDPTTLTLAFAVILAVALLGCTLALALSVWARRPHEVVLVIYTFWILALLLWPIWFGFSRSGLLPPPSSWTLVANPFYLAFAPYGAPHATGWWDYAVFFIATLSGSVALTLLAVRRMRPVACRGAGDPRQKSGLGRLGRVIRWLPGPSLDGNPVLWREWHRSRPSPWMVGLLVVVGGTTLVACVIGAVTTWVKGVDPFLRNPGSAAGMFGYVLQVLFGLLMLAAVAPMSMSEERQRGSLDLLAATTLSTPMIVRGKWMGTFRLVPFLAIGPGLMALALATARKVPMPVPPGFPPDFYKELSRGGLFYAVALLIATILVHGAFLTSVGLALATWIKRQSRAIAISVCLFVMVAVGWPFLAGAIRPGRDTRGFMSLSPIMVAGAFGDDILSSRLVRSRYLLWWTTFWDVELTVLALGLLWLTVGTFDDCFGRIPERPRRTPWLADVVVILGAMAGVGGLLGAITLWVNGARLEGPDRWSLEMVDGLWSLILIVAIGLLLVSTVATMSMSRERQPRLLGVEAATVLSVRRLVLVKWWESFRLVLILAIGPLLIAPALATAHQVIPIVPKVTNLPTGTTVVISTDGAGTPIVTTIQPSGARIVRMATPEEITEATGLVPREPRLGQQLSIAALVVLTILAQGAAIASIGLALGVWIRRRNRAIAVGIGVFLVVAIGWPILASLVQERYHARGLAALSPLAAFGFLLVQVTTRQAQLRDIQWWAAIGAVAAIVATSGGWWLTIRRLEHELARMPSGNAWRVAREA
jgi:ABC-type transport system involved in multi-copper enzyme maturation permease subunit